MEAYQQEYEEFMKAYELSGGTISPQEIGAIIAKMAGHFARYNSIANVLAKPYNRLKAQKVDETDPKTGKLIAVSKAEMIIDASPENEAYQDALTARKNIDCYIDALKQLQYGVQREYNHAGLS